MLISMWWASLLIGGKINGLWAGHVSRWARDPPPRDAPGFVRERNPQKNYPARRRFMNKWNIQEDVQPTATIEDSLLKSNQIIFFIMTIQYEWKAVVVTLALIKNKGRSTYFDLSRVANVIAGVSPLLQPAGSPCPSSSSSSSSPSSLSERILKKKEKETAMESLITGHPINSFHYRNPLMREKCGRRRGSMGVAAKKK